MDSDPRHQIPDRASASPEPPSRPAAAPAVRRRTRSVASLATRELVALSLVLRPDRTDARFR